MRRVLFVLVVCLVSCGPSQSASAPATPADALAQQLAAADAGGAGRLLPNDRRVALYAARLVSLQRKCAEDVHRLAEELRFAHRTVREAGRAVTFGHALFAVDGAIPDDAAGELCAERFAEWASKELSPRAYAW